MNWALWLFWGAAALLAYTYLGFPLLVMLRGTLFRRRWAMGTAGDVAAPSVSLIVVAHNEAASIGAKLDNILALDYPPDRLQVIVASDGSDDGTDTIVNERLHRWADTTPATRGTSALKLLSLPRQGKIPALNAAVAAATGDLLVFSDANSMYGRQALHALVRHFADPSIGGVAGDQRYCLDAQIANLGERAYWSFDGLLKRFQTAAGSATSATGAIYAIRRALFRPVPPGVTDDFTASTGVIAQGYRLVFDPEAVAYEPVSCSSGIEFGRKVRIITRGLHGVWVMRRLLNPFRYGSYSWQLFSHKLLRRLMFVPLLVLLAVTPLLWANGWCYRTALAAQGIVYACAVLGVLTRGTRAGRAKPLSIPFFFLLVNTACLVACWNVLRGRRIDRWQPQGRDVRGGSAALSLVKPH